MGQIRDGILVGDLAAGNASGGANSAALPPGRRRPESPQP
jgi:hypothetical protein